jgi:histidine triad (HIT) family protein
MVDCVFCAIAAMSRPAPVVFADEHAMAFLDARPVYKGHVLVIPRVHSRTLADLPPHLNSLLFALVQRISAAMPTALGVQGSFIGINNPVGQSVPHLHVHVVPRSNKDSELHWTASLLGLLFGRLLWPRSRYSSKAEESDYARRLKSALGE